MIVCNKTHLTKLKIDFLNYNFEKYMIFEEYPIKYFHYIAFSKTFIEYFHE